MATDRLDNRNKEARSRIVRNIYPEGVLTYTVRNIYVTYIVTYICNRLGYPRGVMVKALDCRTVVRKFELQSRYYAHFWTNTFGKGMNLLILPAMD